jgi:hypothetical protein
MSVLDQVRDLERKVVGRLRELEPLMREYEQLRKAAQRLGVKYRPGTDSGVGELGSSGRRRTGSRPAASSGAGGKAKATATAKRPTKSTSGSRKSPTRQRAGGRRATASPGQRQAEVLRLVGEHPGIKVSEIGTRLGVDATGLYRVVRRLTAEGRLRKDGAQLYLAETQTSEPPAPPESTSAEATQ